MEKGYLFTSESVTEGHPDKVADQISDAVLDEYLKQDATARVACEVMVTTGTVYVAGEITSTAEVNIEEVVRETIREIGYVGEDFGFDADTCDVHIKVDEQSQDIAQGVDDALESRDNEEDALTGAGDQGIIFGFASRDTESFLPYTIHYAHRLAEKLTELRKKDIDKGYIRPDGKTQVTVKYNDKGEIEYVDTVVISVQHKEDVTQEFLKDYIADNVINKVIDEKYMTEQTKVYINPSGRFVIGGPQGDVGLTGRKIIVDTYGGTARHGGGAMSGKDATKVDRSAAYMARYIAKNIVGTGLVDECEIQLGYAIGKAQPVSVYVETFGTEKDGVTTNKLVEVVKEVFSLDPDGMIKMLNLTDPIYKETAAYGHFGRNGFTWEKLDKVTEIKEKLGIQ